MEKRKKSRIPFHVKSTLTINGDIINGEVDNLSLDGLLIITNETIDIGKIVGIKLDLTGKSSKLSLECIGRVVRSVENGVAIEFTDIDMDSFIHIRNIVTHDLLDEDKITKEFEDVVFNRSFKD